MGLKCFRSANEEKHLLAVRALQWQFINVSALLDFDKQKETAENQLNMAAEKVMELTNELNVLHLESEETKKQIQFQLPLDQQKSSLEILVEMFPSFEILLKKLSEKLFNIASLLPVQNVDLGDLGSIVCSMLKAQDCLTSFLEKHSVQREELLKLKDVCCSLVGCIKQEYSDIQECISLFRELEELQTKENIQQCHKSLEASLQNLN
ncbi:hypothetical protein DSO57_1010429 [Entomophthora muscae]|uniref:Uncharacterized protein n=1 Tax=Entomophthora muscae TaxID=34485 RepID=A0ACC2S8F1_9FUNG|nr:hypothetical protein DSO57_1010429 [Entomophthora muscae]